MLTEINRKRNVLSIRVSHCLVEGHFLGPCCINDSFVSALYFCVPPKAMAMTGPAVSPYVLFHKLLHIFTYCTHSRIYALTQKRSLTTTTLFISTSENYYSGIVHRMYLCSLYRHQSLITFAAYIFIFVTKMLAVNSFSPVSC